MANIVVLAVKFCALVLNKPPALKLPLFSAAGVTVPVCGAKKFTKIFAVPELGAAVNVKVVPSGMVYADVSCTTPSTDTRTSCTELTVLLNVKVVSDPSPLNLCTAVVASKL